MEMLDGYNWVYSMRRLSSSTIDTMRLGRDLQTVSKDK